MVPSLAEYLLSNGTRETEGLLVLATGPDWAVSFSRWTNPPPGMELMAGPKGLSSGADGPGRGVRRGPCYHTLRASWTPRPEIQAIQTDCVVTANQERALRRDKAERRCPSRRSGRSTSLAGRRDLTSMSIMSHYVGLEGLL